MPSLRFALIGAAGFVAPRHLQAIHDVGGKLVAACDISDSVGVLDKFDRSTLFCTDESEFAHCLYANRVDWLVVCTPNYLHVRHTLLGLRNGANVLCEKPIALTAAGLDTLEIAECTMERRVYTVLQLRHMPKLLALKQSGAVGSEPAQVTLTYNTPRGPWYDKSWKGDAKSSGGLITNIGIHMLDLLLWIFGDVVDAKVRVNEPRIVGGDLQLTRANVSWLLAVEPTAKPMRLLTVNGVNVEFTDGFEGLHRKVYEETLAGRGHGIADARPAVELAQRLRG